MRPPDPGLGRFLASLDTRQVGELRKQLLADLSYRSSNGMVYTVPSGFVSDGASVPRPVWWLYPPFGELYEPAAWLHDHLYANAEAYPGTDHGHVSRAEADGLLWEAARVTGFRPAGCEFIYQAVRLGGWLAWRRYRRAMRDADDA
jgi:Protein of unknown function (DUF1353)